LWWPSWYCWWQRADGKSLIQRWRLETGSGLTVTAEQLAPGKTAACWKTVTGTLACAKTNYVAKAFVPKP